MRGVTWGSAAVVAHQLSARRAWRTRSARQPRGPPARSAPGCTSPPSAPACPAAPRTHPGGPRCRRLHNAWVVHAAVYSKSYIKRQTDRNRPSLPDSLCSEATCNLQLHVCVLTQTAIGMRADPASPVGTSTRVSCVMRRAARALEVAAAQPGTTSMTPLDPAINAVQI